MTAAFSDMNIVFAAAGAGRVRQTEAYNRLMQGLRVVAVAGEIIGA
jgi:hypothetical protein